MSGGQTLAELRASIDGVDAQLVGLLLARVELVRKVGAVKASEGLPAHDAAREEAVVDGAVRLASSARADNEACAIIRDVMTGLARRYREEVARTSR